MRSVNLIPRHHVQLPAWEKRLASRFPKVWLEYSEGLAEREGLPRGVANKLGIEDGFPHVLILERPTTIHEYEPEEIEDLRKIAGEPKQFFAVDYTDERLLRRVLWELLQHEGEGRVVVEDEQGNLALLEVFLETAK